MAKTARKKPTTQVRKKTTRSKKSVVVSNGSLLSTDGKGPWGKDQPMILIMSAGIVIFIAVALFLTGWL